MYRLCHIRSDRLEPKFFPVFPIFDRGILICYSCFKLTGGLEHLLDNLNPHPQYKRTGFFALWAVSVVLSIVFYAENLSAAIHHNANKVCSTTGMWEALHALVQPSNWFGLFTIAITVIGVQQLYKAARSRWNMVENYKTLALVTLVAVVLMFLSLGCS